MRKKILRTCLTALCLAQCSMASVSFARNWENVNADPFTGSLGHNPQSKEDALSQAPLAVRLHTFPEPVQRELLQKVKEGCGVTYFIRKGDYIHAMLAGKGEILRELTVNWKNREVPLPAMWYQVDWEGKSYVLICPILCYNWIRGDEDGKILMRLPDYSVSIQSDLTYVQYEGQKVTADQAFAEKKKDDGGGEYDAIIEQARVDSERFLKSYWEHHPDGGLYGAQSEIARWVGTYVDYIAWQKRYDPEFGLGVFANGNIGEMRNSDYRWKEIFLAVQIGTQKTWADFVSNNIRQIQLKVRPGLFFQEGSSSTYEMSRAEFGIDAHMEYAHQLNTKTVGYIVANGFWDVDNLSFSSTWKGDSPDDRSRIGLGFELNHYLNPEWDFRWGIGAGYSFYDQVFGLTAFGKFRYQNTWSFGVNGMYPLALGIYDGIYTASQLAWYGGMVQFELGDALLEKPDQEYRSGNINQIPRSGAE